MLRFFRRIRKGLLAPGATRKYILYAVGEILLVMIGILLALQINNWNEFQKDRVKEKELLSDVAKDLERNCKMLDYVMEFNLDCDKSADLIISIIKNGYPYSDSLSLHFHKARIESHYNLNLTVAGYKALKSSGFDIIRSDTLKDAILDLYEDSYQRLLSFAHRRESGYPDRIRLIDQHFISENKGLITPIDFDKLISDQAYFVFLKRLKQERYGMKIRARSRLAHTQNVLKLIKDELHGAD